jgi:RimJ/RimL family protein N-acetyltransferase
VRRRDPAEPQLVNVRHVARAVDVLWQLLSERPSEANISHAAMPTWKQHMDFVEHHPYRVWYLIRHGAEFVGAIYLTRHFEIGLAILAEHQRKGYATWAVREVVAKWTSKLERREAVSRGAFLANIAPANAASQRFFESLGFKYVQQTYALDLKP